MSKPKDLNLTFSGCGFLGIYHLGVVSCLKDNAPAFLERVKCYGGASAGTFAPVALLMDLNVAESAEFVLRLAKRAKSLTLGPLHPSFHIQRTVRRSFEKILPENAHELASGRLHISLTRVLDFTNVIVSEFRSKDDLIEALLASSHVPFYFSILPAKFRGKYYIDGGISDNLPQHFTEGETITVSPFSGESDICPKDGSPNFAHLYLRNTSVQFTLQNLYRCSRAFFPPEAEVLCEMCKQGYRDTLRFLQTHYPETLSKESLRNSSTSIVPLSGLPLSRLHVDSCVMPGQVLPRRRTSTSSLSAYSTCSSGEAFTTAESNFDGDQEEVDENESRLVTLLHRTNDAITEAELWSCYFIRKVMWVLQLGTRPCVFSIKQMTHIAHCIVLALPMIEKTGSQFLDQLLAMIYMVVHTYMDKHKVENRSLVQFTPLRRNQLPTTDLAHSEVDPEAVQQLAMMLARDMTSSRDGYGLSCTDTDPDVTSDTTSEDSEIEIILDRSLSSTSSTGSYEFCSKSFTMLGSTTTLHDTPEDLQQELGQWESEGGACPVTIRCLSADVLSDDYVVLDGYETDIESDNELESGFATLYRKPFVHQLNLTKN